MSNEVIVYPEHSRGLRFVVKKDEWCNGDEYLFVYDTLDFIVVGYFDVDDFGTARDVCDTVNRLAGELEYVERELSEVKSLVDKDVLELADEVKSLEREVRAVKGVCNLRLRYNELRLEEVLSVYPYSRSLSDFMGVADFSRVE